MKHSKQRNVGIMFEILNHAVLNEISKGHNKTAAGIFSVIKKYFMSETEISKAYKVYSQLLYSEARNSYYAARFFGSLVKEYHQSVDSQKLYNENTKLLDEISRVCDRKSIMKVNVPNYKLFASFNILVNENNVRLGGQYLTSRDKLACEENIFEHLVENKEAKRIKEANSHHTDKPSDQLQTETLALGIALKNFDKKYGKLLTTEQKDCLVKYYTTKDDKNFSTWIKKRVGNILDEVADKKISIDNQKILTKVELVEQKLRGIVQEEIISTNSLKDILLSLEMKDNLKMF
tara:strand:- start:219 stop:1091 length:873 start_codon:yes stop_codon:yes gene_type:complete